MNLAAVMAELGTLLDTIPGLQAFGYPSESIRPPAAMVGWPEELTYDETYGRGSDRMTLPVIVAVSRVVDRVAVERLGKFANGSGEHSVKQAIEQANTWSAFDTARVASVEFDWVLIADTSYVSAIFAVEVAGQGK